MEESDPSPYEYTATVASRLRRSARGASTSVACVVVRLAGAAGTSARRYDHLYRRREPATKPASRADPKTTDAATSTSNRVRGYAASLISGAVVHGGAVAARGVLGGRAGAGSPSGANVAYVRGGVLDAADDDAPGAPALDPVAGASGEVEEGMDRECEEKRSEEAKRREGGRGAGPGEGGGGARDGLGAWRAMGSASGRARRLAVRPSRCLQSTPR